MVTPIPDLLTILIIVWTFTCAAVIIMTLRLIMRKLRKRRFEAGDYVTMACIFSLLVRSATLHVVIIWGTNNIPKAFRDSHEFTADDLYQLGVGSKLIIVDRLFYNSYLWLQKVVVMCLYKGFLSRVPWACVALKFNWAILAVTYVAIQIATIGECHPINLYWQVVPDPGICVRSTVQLFVLGALNILTDVILIALPITPLVKLRLPLVKRIQLVLLFSIGILLVVVTIVRIPQNYANLTTESSRTIWGSIETFAAALVANIPTIYTLRSRTATPSPPVYDKRIVVTKCIDIDNQNLASSLNQNEYLDVSEKRPSRETLPSDVCDLAVAPELGV